MRWSTYQRLRDQYDEPMGHRHDAHVEPVQRAAEAALG
jgi:hypothetical protein